MNRLLAEAGLTYRFEETGIGEPATMVIVADTTDAQSCPEDTCSASAIGGQGLRFHRPGQTQEQDGVTQIDASYHWSASTLTATSSDYKSGQVISALQEAGWIDIAPLPSMPRLSMIGLFPTLQSVVAQAAALLAVVIGFAVTNRRGRHG